MLIIPFNQIKHNKHAITLLNARGMDPNLVNDLPEHGLIALEGDTPIAMGFIRRVEGLSAMLDSYITAPNASSEARGRAVTIITRKLLHWAKSGGCMRMMSFSLEPSFVTRAEALGFVPMPHKLLVKNL